jgi:predicted ATPase
VVNHLLSPKVRLVTLTGAPGIGKTRLALQAAWQLLEHFEDGAYVVDLTPVSDPDIVLPSTARALGLKEEAEGTLEAALLNHLQEKRTLLLLDNFDQVLDAAPQVVDLVEKTPWIRVLITSREALHVRGERRFPVPPLALPDGRHLPPPRVLEANPSVELFLEREPAVDPSFALTQENAEDVAAICIGLEGLPLPIELAAARVTHFSVAGIRSALGSPSPS